MRRYRSSIIGKSNNKKTRAYGIPTIDLSSNEDSSNINLSDQIVKACEEVGMFKVVNHGVSDKVVAAMETEALNFFAKPTTEKERAGPANPFGYGCKNIGFNGDKGELEYILLEANPESISRRSKAILSSSSSAHHHHESNNFSRVVMDYVEAVKDVGCEVVELAAEGLGLKDKRVFSSLLRHPESDSCFRINHYPNNNNASSPSLFVGFGEHSDPQILTVLRSNEVDGLEIWRDGLWVPVPPDPDHLFVLVGDAFEALTNGRFKSVRHRVVGSNSSLLSLEQPRMSMMYFGAPPIKALISPMTQMLLPPHDTMLYKPFTWGEYKQAVYSLRLAHDRLHLFKNV